MHDVATAAEWSSPTGHSHRREAIEPDVVECLDRAIAVIIAIDRGCKVLIRERRRVFVLFLTSSTTVNAAAVGVDWISAGATSTGTLTGVGLTMTGFFDSGQFIATADLATDPDFSAAPLGASQEVLNFGEGSAWTVTFDTPVSDLLLYAKFWRSGNTYDFDHAFTIVDGMSNTTVGPGDSITLNGGFIDGILKFAGPISSLSVVPSGGSSSGQLLTFGVVPEPAAAALLALCGLALPLRRRRRSCDTTSALTPF